MNVYLREGARSLYSTKQRTLLALIGIVIGIGSVIALVTIAQMVTEEATREFQEMGTDLLRVSVNATSPNRQQWMRDPLLYEGMADALRCVRVAAPYIRGYDRERRIDDEEVALIGATQSFLPAAQLQLSSGRFVSILDGEQAFAVVGAKLPAHLGYGQNPDELIGTRININDQDYHVIGVLKPGKNMDSMGLDVDRSFIVPIANLLQAEPSRSINQIMERSHQGYEPAGCGADVTQYMQRRIPNVEVRIRTAEELIARMRSQTDMLGTLLIAIGSISLVVGGVGIMNIMLVSVSERRQEIGIRRALGATRMDIMKQFLIESVLLSLVGGLLGIIVGLIVAYVVAENHQWQFFVTAGPLLLGAGVSVAIGAFFGFFPARQAAHLDPIVALRSE